MTKYSIVLLDPTNGNAVELGCHDEDGVFRVNDDIQARLSAFFSGLINMEDVNLEVDEIEYSNEPVNEPA